MRAEVGRNISEDELLERCAANTVKKTGVLDKLIQLEIPSNVVYWVMIYCQDVGDLNPRHIAESYFKLLGLGLTKTAAATIAASEYVGRGREEALELIARNYHTIKSAHGYSNFRTLDPITRMRYKKITGYPEARLALMAISDYEEAVYGQIRPNEG